MSLNVKDHLLAKIADARIVPDPFPHVVIEQVFPPEFYQSIQDNLLSDDAYTPLVETGRVTENYNRNRLCFMGGGDATSAATPQALFWNELFAIFMDRGFMGAWLRRFESVIRQRLTTDLPEVRGDKLMLYPEVFLMRDKNSFLLTPHMDARKKAVTALFYLPRSDDRPSLGTSLYRIRNRADVSEMGTQFAREDFDLVKTIPYRPNTMLAFANSSGAFHGLEPLAGVAGGRDVLIYDVKFLGVD